MLPGSRLLGGSLLPCGEVGEGVSGNEAAIVRRLRPHQRNGLGEIADVSHTTRDSTGSVRDAIRSRISPGWRV